MQWVTAKDLAEFNSWVKTCDRLTTYDPIEISLTHGILIIPMAGMGKHSCNQNFKPSEKPFSEMRV